MRACVCVCVLLNHLNTCWPHVVLPQTAGHCLLLPSAAALCCLMVPQLAGCDRLLLQEVDIGGVTVPEGLTVVCNVYAMHRHPDFWPQVKGGCCTIRCIIIATFIHVKVKVAVVGAPHPMSWFAALHLPWQ
jgi:hypothetical protein